MLHAYEIITQDCSVLQINVAQAIPMIPADSGVRLYSEVISQVHLASLMPSSTKSSGNNNPRRLACSFMLQQFVQCDKDGCHQASRFVQRKMERVRSVSTRRYCGS